MRRPPRAPEAAILDSLALRRIGGYGLYIGLATIVAFQIWLYDPSSAPRAQTMAFTVIILAEIFNVMNFRASGLIDRRGWAANPLMPFALAATLALHVAAVNYGALQMLLGTVPLSLVDWAWAVLLSAPVMLLPGRRVGGSGSDRSDPSDRFSPAAAG
jgi:Ca2+-transporting ATPase